MEALIAAKLNPVQVKRTSLTKHMHQARVALHAALNGMKPRLMRGKMLQELYKGVDEVKVLEKIKRGLQSEDRIICEELVALHDRKHCQWLEVVKEKRRLARCLENLEQKQHSHDKAEEELARADDPATFLQNAVEAAERMTDRRVKDLTEFLDQKTEGILQSTKYSLDVLSLLLGESMPVPKEVPLVLHLSWDELTREEEDDDFEDGDEVEGGGSEDEEDEDEDEDEGQTTNGIDGSDHEEDEDEKEKEKEEEEETKGKNHHDPVASATAKHRQAVGLSPVTKRTSQQAAFLSSLAPKNGGSDDGNSEDKDEDEDEEGATTKEAVTNVNPEEAVKAYGRSQRQAAIAHVGKDDWITMNWQERYDAMLEFVTEEEKEEEYEVPDDYEDQVFSREVRYFESTADEGTARCPQGGIQEHHQRGGGRKRTKYDYAIRAGLLSDEKYPLLIATLLDLSRAGGESLTSLVNSEKKEMMEGYMEIQHMCRYTLQLGRSGELGADIWAWIEAVFEYTRALPIYDQLVENLANAAVALEIAQGIYDVAEAREAASSLKLKKLVALIPQTKWYRRRQQKRIDEHNNVMRTRTKWPVYLRPLDGPAKFTVMVQQVASMRGKSARLLRVLQATSAEVHQRQKVFELAGTELDKVRKECDDVLCPWHWYMPDGRKWASMIHNKWFVQGQRVTVFDDETGREVPGTLTEVDIHPNGRKKIASVQYDGGGSDSDIPHIRLIMQYPQKVPISRALEDYQDKFVSTLFNTACETPMLVNIKMVVIKLEKVLNVISTKYEDARTGLNRADTNQHQAAAEVIQCIWRRSKQSNHMKIKRTWKSGEKMRAFLSANLIKFRKMRERNAAFAVRFLTREKGCIHIQRVVRGHLARVKYHEVLEAIAEAERERVEMLENRRQEKEFANRLRAAQIAKERTKTWRCPRCPLSVAFKQKFTTPQEIEAHIAVHDAMIQREYEALQAQEAAEMEIKRVEALARSSKEQIALAKMRRLMEERRVKMEIEAVEQAKRHREKKVQQMNALFTIKYQRPLLPSLRKGGFKTYNTGDFAPTPLSPPYPELRLVRDAQRPITAKWKKQLRSSRSKRSKKINLLPEKIFITCTPFRFGRSSSCDSPLDCYQHSGLVSKDHALMFVRGSPMVGYTLIMADLHSTNGTFVNQQRIKPGSGTEYDRNNRTLEEGAIVVFGCTKSPPTPENPSGIVLSTVCYQLWKDGSGFHDEASK